jgi:peptidyl-prolyl cis-trans isomerase C
MKRFFLSLAVVVAAASGTANVNGAPGDAAGDAARRAKVVARVGARTITAGELEDRLATIPRFQLADFDPNLEVAKRKFLEQILVREVLLDIGAEKRGLAESPAIKPQLLRARANATLRAIRRSVPAPDRIDAADVKAYYDAHLAQYDAPERIAIWRIVVKTREEAQSILEAARKDPTVQNFTTLARDKSLDKATNLRGGNLGFLSDDGVSNEAGLRVERSVVQAAKTVKDGELVSAPVAEGGNFAVVWRRGTVKATKQSLADVDEQIRVILARRKADEATQRFLDEAKRARVGPIDTELVKTIDLPSFLEPVPVRSSAAKVP